MFELAAILQNCSRRYTQTAYRIGRATINVMFPPCCAKCGSILTNHDDGCLACLPCRTALITSFEYACRRCAVPVPASAATANDCPNCRNAKFNFTESMSLGVYAGSMREAVLRMKQAAHEPLTMSIGRLLADRIHQRGLEPWPDILVSVPMHWSRRFRRGINQSELLVAAVSQRLRIPARDGLLTCWRKIKKQGTLSPDERRKNVRDAFRLSRGYDIKDARVLVVDDVMTTGATANEVARVCRKAGAESVAVAIVARAIGAN